jgi:cysteine desulfurase
MNKAYDIIYPEIDASDNDDIITSSTTEGNNAVIKTFIDVRHTQNFVSEEL